MVVRAPYYFPILIHPPISDSVQLPLERRRRRVVFCFSRPTALRTLCARFRSIDRNSGRGCSVLLLSSSPTNCCFRGLRCDKSRDDNPGEQRWTEQGIAGGVTEKLLSRYTLCWHCYNQLWADNKVPQPIDPFVDLIIRVVYACSSWIDWATYEWVSGWVCRDKSSNTWRCGEVSRCKNSAQVIEVETKDSGRRRRQRSE